MFYVANVCGNCIFVLSYEWCIDLQKFLTEETDRIRRTKEMIFGAKSTGKSICLTISAVIVLFLLFACVSIPFYQPAIATENNGKVYYSQLSGDEQKFYDAMVDMYNKGSLELGNQEYDLIDKGVVTAEQAQKYADGDRSLLKSFERARNAFCMEQNVFYVDFSKFELSIGIRENKYVVTMGTGRNSNYYANGFTSQTDVTTAKEQYKQELKTLVDTANAQESNFDKISSANSQILTKVAFGYGINASGGVEAQKAGQIITNYGALINGVAVYEGYARLMRDMLSAMNIENVLVSGYVLNENESFVPAMWNYVKLGNSWYAIDCAMNDLSAESDEFLLVGQEKMRYQHYFANDLVAQEANISLSVKDYGYIEPIEVICSWGQPATMTVSYLGKNATALAEQEQYLSFRINAVKDGGTEPEWGNWVSFSAQIASNEGTYSSLVTENPTATVLTLPNDAIKVQFAVINVAPTASGEYGTVEDSQFVVLGDEIVNQSQAGFSPAPTAKKVVPSNAEVLDADKTYTIVIVYDEPLEKFNSADPIGVKITASRGAVVEADTQVFWSGTNDSDTVSFSFTASALFNDNYQTYSFEMKNLVGNKSKKSPNPVLLSFQKSNVNLSKYSKTQNGDSLSLSPNNNLDLSGWTFKTATGSTQNGNNAYLNQLSFVSSSINSAESQKIVEKIIQQQNLHSADIYSSRAYDISLSLCGGEVTFTNGKMLKIEVGNVANNANLRAFVCQKDGEGKFDLTKITELQTFVSGGKLVIETNKFGALIVLGVSGNANQQRVLYVNNVNNNGVILAKVNGVTQTDIIPLKLDESVILEFTPSSDYVFGACLLDGKTLSVEDNKVIISFNDLRERNVLDVSFVASRVANYENTVGLANLQTSYLANQYLAPEVNLGLIVCVAICGAVLLALMITWLVVLVRNNKREKIAHEMGL